MIRIDIVKECLKDFYMIANEKKPLDFERIAQKWEYQTREIKIENLQKSFDLAQKNNKKTKIPLISQVLDENRMIESATLNHVTSKDDERKNLKPGDFPTQEQHRKAVRVMTAVLNGKIETGEGKMWLDKIFAGMVP